MTIFSPWLWLGILLAVAGAYGGGRLQQKIADGAVYQKKVDAMLKAADEAKAAEELRREQETRIAEEAQAAREKQRGQQLAAAQARIKNLDAALSATRVASVAGLLNRTLGESAAPAGTTAKPAEAAAPAATGADTTVGLWAGWSVAMIDWANNCRDIVAGWQTYYGKLKGS